MRDKDDPGPRTQRRIVAAFATTLIIATVVVALPRHAADPPGGRGNRVSPSTSPAPADDMPPAWLAWIAGTLPDGLAAAAQAEPGLETTVVVAGDTLWMTESRDAKHDVVDHPDPPYEIPIDAFAVTPSAYEPFMPESSRGPLRTVLSDGLAILGESSAALRGIGAGGTLVFGSQEVIVGGVVPDPVVGFAEMLVSRDLGRRLGIVNDRYLLSLPDGQMTDARFARIMGSLIPDTDILILAPGGGPYMRIASGVNPPVVTKTLFGEFAAARHPADTAFFDIDPAWVDAHIVTREVPLLGTVTCHEALIPPLVAALQEVVAAGLGDEITVYSGCWAARTVRRSSTAPPSQHAYGAAIDINAPQNPIGTEPVFDRRVVRIFQAHGFKWGGGFLYPDGHHFEWGLSTPSAQ